LLQQQNECQFIVDALFASYIADNVIKIILDGSCVYMKEKGGKSLVGRVAGHSAPNAEKVSEKWRTKS